MEPKRVYLLAKLLLLFILVLFTEYILCGVYFRLVRTSDLLRVDLLGGAASLVICSLTFKNLIRDTRKFRILFPVTLASFAVFCVMSACFFRLSLQLANGLLDRSEPQPRVVVITDKKISSIGGSIKDGLDPVAHLIYFKDWDDIDKDCELLTTPLFYYTVGVGTEVELNVHEGFFRWAWVEDYRAVKSRWRN